MAGPEIWSGTLPQNSVGCLKNMPFFGFLRQGHPT